MGHSGLTSINDTNKARKSNGVKCFWDYLYIEKLLELACRSTTTVRLKVVSCATMAVQVWLLQV